MTRQTGVPVPPPDRGLPDPRRLREELLMTIDPERRASMRRRWMLPLGIAAAVTAMGVTTVVAFGADSPAAAGQKAGPGAGTVQTAAGARPTSGGTELPPGLREKYQYYPDIKVVATGDACTAYAKLHNGDGPGSGFIYAFVGKDPAQIYCLTFDASKLPPQVDPTAPVITANPLTPLPADRVVKILKSCLGAGASKYHAVIAVRTAIATQHQDAEVIAKSTDGKFAVCTALGDSGTLSVGNGLKVSGPDNVADFDSGTDFSTAGSSGYPTSYLMFDSGSYGAGIAKITVSYGSETKEYPALMADGAFHLTVSTPWEADYSHPPVSHIHGYDAAGKEVYEVGVPTTVK